MRREPTLSDIGYSMRRYYIDTFHEGHISLLPTGSDVLDLGGHKYPKRGVFNIENYDLKVIYANLVTDKHPDVQCYAQALPFPYSSFDVVICAELLEHVPDPRDVLQEAHRVLKPGGMLFITVPFLAYIHADPFDYGRYTDYYWSGNLHTLGFKDIVIEKQGLFWSVLVEMLGLWVKDLIQRYKRRSAIGIFARLGSLALGVAKYRAIAIDSRADQSMLTMNTRHTTGFGIHCKKQ